jgi:hypothetical protein
MLQPGSFDQVRQTISALAAYGAADRLGCPAFSGRAIRG